MKKKGEMNPQTLNINTFEIAKFFICGKLLVTKDVSVGQSITSKQVSDGLVNSLGRKLKQAIK